MDVPYYSLQLARMNKLKAKERHHKWFMRQTSEKQQEIIGILKERGSMPFINPKPSITQTLNALVRRNIVVIEPGKGYILNQEITKS